MIALLSSSQVGFDQPFVTNDMILRFMDVDFSDVPGIAATTPSRIGDDSRLIIGLAGTSAGGLPLLKGGSTDWECESKSVRLAVVED